MSQQANDKNTRVNKDKDAAVAAANGSCDLDSGAAVIDRLRRLRREMAQRSLAAWVCPTGDPHLCEYEPKEWAFRRYLSGFTGSAGTLAVTSTSAALWTDSRYWEQAEKELAPSGIDLMPDGAPETPELAAALSSELDPGAHVGVDPRTMSRKRFQMLKAALQKSGLVLVSDTTMIDAVWPERPAAGRAPVRRFEFGQKAASEKLSAVRAATARAGAQALLLSSLEDIAWITNLRGGDLACTPVFAAYALVLDKSAHLFVDEAKLTDDIKAFLAAGGFSVLPYAQAFTEIPALLKNRSVLIDPAKTSEALFEVLQEAGVRIVAGEQPTELIKSRKSPEELALLRETMRRDGAAMCELFAWIEKRRSQEKPLTEMDVSRKLLALRSEIPGFMGLSFETIAAAGPNAALPHYQPGEKTAAQIKEGDLLLIDSGGQYEGGTTDITRTIVYGCPTDAQRRDFTAVLRGHILLATTHFPQGTFASQLDTLARMPIWEIGCDFGHGTGHGVGFCLSVHEGPVSISPRAQAKASSRVVPGLVLSNEPGLYRPGRWGVRTENLVTPVAAEYEVDQMTPMLVMETLTLCPIDTRLILTSMMTPFEIWWVNDYHRRVREALMPLLSVEAQAWLKRATETI